MYNVYNIYFLRFIDINLRKIQSTIFRNILLAIVSSPTQISTNPGCPVLYIIYIAHDNHYHVERVQYIEYWTVDILNKPHNEHRTGNFRKNRSRISSLWFYFPSAITSGCSSTCSTINLRPLLEHRTTPPVPDHYREQLLIGAIRSLVGTKKFVANILVVNLIPLGFICNQQTVKSSSLAGAEPWGHDNQMWGKACSYLYRFSYMNNSNKEGFNNARFNPRAPKIPKNFHVAHSSIGPDQNWTTSHGLIVNWPTLSFDPKL